MVASLGAVRKDKPNGVTARVLFIGTNGIEANEKTTFRDQERATLADFLELCARKQKARSCCRRLRGSPPDSHRSEGLASPWVPGTFWRHDA